MPAGPEEPLTKEEARAIELAVAMLKQTARRNLAVFLALVGFVLVWWQDWSRWTALIPTAFGLYGLLAQLDILLMKRERNSRR